MTKLILLLLCIGVATALTPQLRIPPRRPVPPPLTFTAQPQTFARPFTAQAQTFARPTPTFVRTSSSDPAAVYIVKETREDEGNGAYNWAYQNSDGSEAEQRGYVKNLGTNNEIQVMEGSYTYYDSEAKLVRVRYIADELGFRVLEDTRRY